MTVDKVAQSIDDFVEAPPDRRIADSVARRQAFQGTGLQNQFRDEIQILARQSKQRVVAD